MPTPYYNRIQARRAGSARPLRSARAKSPDASPNNSLGDLDVSGLIAGGLGLTANFLSVANQRFNIGDPPKTEYSLEEQPTYSGDFYNQAYNLDPQGAGTGEILQGVASGALAGSSFGIPGAAAGALVGGVGTAIAGRSREKKQEKERRDALNKASMEQKRFNEASDKYDANRLMMEDYYKRSDITDQLYNLYAQ